jgi:hypothetical protein
VLEVGHDRNGLGAPDYARCMADRATMI